MENQNDKLLYFGKRLAECRRNNYLTQEELANRIGVTPQALSKWENGISTPDLTILSLLCEILNVNANDLLGIKNARITENDNAKIQSEIWSNLRTCLEPLVLVFGEGIVPLFMDNNKYIDKICALRLNLSKQGILMPIVRIKDETNLKKNEWMVLAYDNILYSEEIESIYESSLEHIIEKFGCVIQDKYAEIINADILKSLTDNLKIKYPAQIEGIVPDIIPYGLLLDVVRGFINRGNRLLYLPKIIEVIEHEQRNNNHLSATELIEVVCNQLEREDNFWVVLKHR